VVLWVQPFELILSRRHRFVEASAVLELLQSFINEAGNHKRLYATLRKHLNGASANLRNYNGATIGKKIDGALQ